MFAVCSGVFADGESPPDSTAVGVTFVDAHSIHLPMDEMRETGLELDPKFDAAGLITAVVTDAASGAVLMVAHMDAEALAATFATGEAHFFSRSRKRLWRKGETSGNVLRVIEMRVDCDQDAVWVIAEPAGPACHTGEASCFYRRMTTEGLERV